jgi:hypothetical protein
MAVTARAETIYDSSQNCRIGVGTSSGALQADPAYIGGDKELRVAQLGELSCSEPAAFRIENVPDARIIEPTDAVVTVTRACICGSDLWPYQKMERSDTGCPMGHEAIGIVEAVGAEVRTIKAVIL